MQRSTSPRSHAPSARQFVNDLVGQEAFERGVTTAAHLPIELHLQLTSGCNLDCVMCHEHLRPVETRHGRGLRCLDPGLFDRIEREVMPYSSRLHLGVGGEPMLAPSFLELVERAYARNQAIHLTTNGTRIATERVAEVLSRCLATIEISADGATAETYERIRVGASFARLVQNIEFLNRYRLDRRVEDRPRLTLCFVLMRSNAHELPQFVELAARLSADGVAAWPAIPVTAEARADAFDAVHAAPFLEAARARARELGIALDLPFERPSVAAAEPRNARAESLRQLGEMERRAGPIAPPNGASRRQYCHMPSVALYVFWDGRVYPCANPETHPGPPLGDLTQQSFDAIWNGRPFRNLRAGLARGDAPEVCRRCPILHKQPGLVASTNGSSSTSDLVGWFGDRDLAPAADAAPAGALVEQIVASGLGGHVQKRFGAMLAYAQTLEQTARALEEKAGVLENERDVVSSHLAALVSERTQLTLHAQNLDGERLALKQYARTLEQTARELEQRNGQLAHKNDVAAAHLGALALERAQLARHASNLENERGHLVGHADNLAREREVLEQYAQELKRYAEDLERTARELERQKGVLAHENDVAGAHLGALATERIHLVRHANSLERERRHLVGHVANLERILERIRGRAIHRSLARIKDVFVRPRPRPETPYVPPWVADGTRKPGELLPESAAELPLHAHPPSNGRSEHDATSRDPKNLP